MQPTYIGRFKVERSIWYEKKAAALNKFFPRRAKARRSLDRPLIEGKWESTKDKRERLLREATEAKEWRDWHGERE